MAIILPNGKNQYFSNTGTPLAGGKVYTYVAGTTTPKATYTTSAATVANANPVILNSRGEAAIYWNGVYDVTLKDANGVLIWGPERLTSAPESDADWEVARAKRFVVGYDDDADITDNSVIDLSSMLIRYSTAYANQTTRSGLQVQRYIMADTGASINAGIKVTTVLGATNGSDTPVIGDYRSQWDINVEHDNYSDLDDGSVSVGISSTIRRYAAQGTIGMHVNCLDLRIPATANETTFGGITGIEAHSDGIGPDARVSSGTGYGYRQTIRITARTESTTPTWTKRGTSPFGNNVAVAKDDICLPRDAVLTEGYDGPYWVCTTAGTTGAVNTILNGIDTALTEVVDGTVTWECRRGAEIGCGLKVANGITTGAGIDGNGAVFGYYRYGIIVDSNQNGTSPNEMAHGIYVKNSGGKNFESYGDPDFHGHFYGIDDTAVLAIGSADAAAGQSVGALQFKGDSTTDAERLFASVVGQSIDDTDGAHDGRLIFSATTAGTSDAILYLENKNTVIGDKSILGTTATAGFLHIGRCAGAPTGVPDLYTGKCPMVVDSTNGRLYVYHSAAWHYTVLT